MSQKNPDLEIYYYRQRRNVSVDTGEADSDRTKQEFVDECDINSIMSHWESTGLINHASSNPPTYGDFTNQLDYQTALNALASAEESFNQLPSEIRSRMSNDPGKLIDFLSDPSNDEEAIKLGLKNPKPIPSPPPAPEEEPKAPTPPTGGE